MRIEDRPSIISIKKTNNWCLISSSHNHNVHIGMCEGVMLIGCQYVLKQALKICDL